MSTQTLLTISPDKLFEEHGIAEIQAIQLQLQNEIERKREELRNMVGERYRDLLKAADTITEMKDTSKNVILHINQMTALCQALQEKRLIGFKQHSSGNSNRFSDSNDISKIIEMKILLSLPEQIWTAIDNKDYLLAAQLFLLATHIHLQVNVSPNAGIYITKFPVLTKQWEIISSCRKIIIDGAKQQLKIIDLSYKKTSECLCCLFLLEVISHEKLIVQYLDLRMQTLEHILQFDEFTNVKQKLKLTVVLMQHTLAALFHSFLDMPDEGSSVYRELDHITGTEATPTLSKIKQVTSLPECYLSPLIADFHPKTNNKTTRLSQEAVQDQLQQWISSVENLLKVELSNLLNLIVDIKRLERINRETAALEYPQDWNLIVETVLLEKKLNVYENFIRSFMTKRVIELIELVWQNALNAVTSCLKKIDEELRKDRVKQSENDVRWFIWKEDNNLTEEWLRLKTQGYTSRVTQLCSALDDSLSQLLSQVGLYVGHDLLTGTRTDIEKDSLEVLVFLSTCSVNMVYRLAENARQSCHSTENESCLILRCRFLQAVIIQCPNLEKCLRENQWQINKGLEDGRVGNSWQKTVAFLNEQSVDLWRMWKEQTATKLRGLIKDKLDAHISLRNLLVSKPLSEVVTIEEQTEDGTAIKSDIRVPSQPSLPLQELLFHTCQLLNAVGPHTLPRCVHQDLMGTFVKHVLEHYQQLTHSPLIYQSQAWQMLLDIRLLTLLLMARDNKDLSQSLCETLEKTIDPFDLGVYYPFLQNNVKKSAQKLQATFGILINYSEKLAVFNGLKLTASTTNSKVEEPNVLAMSSTIPWFPLLPISTGGTRRTEVVGSKENIQGKTFRTRERESKKESTSSDFVRSAGAFFGAMTGGWS